VLTAGAVMVLTRRTVVTVVRTGAAVVLVVVVAGVVVVVVVVVGAVVATAVVVGIDCAGAALGKWRPEEQPDRVAPTSAVAIHKTGRLVTS
jgi:hypothetical protein